MKMSLSASPSPVLAYSVICVGVVTAWVFDDFNIRNTLLQFCVWNIRSYYCSNLWIFLQLPYLCLQLWRALVSFRELTGCSSISQHSSEILLFPALFDAICPSQCHTAPGYIIKHLDIALYPDSDIHLFCFPPADCRTATRRLRELIKTWRRNFTPW